MAASKCLILTTVILLTGVWIAVSQASSSSSNSESGENAVAKYKRGRPFGESNSDQRAGKNRKGCLDRPRKPRKQKQNKKSQNKPQKKADGERRQKPSKPARTPRTQSSPIAAATTHSGNNERRENLKSMSGNRPRRNSDSLSSSGSSSEDDNLPKPEEEPREPSTTVTPTEPGDAEGNPGTGPGGGGGEDVTSVIGDNDEGDGESEGKEGVDDDTGDGEREEVEDDEDEIISTTVSTDTTVTDFIYTSDMVTKVTTGLQTTESPFCDIRPAPIRAVTLMDFCIIGEKNNDMKISCKDMDPLKCPELPPLPLVKFPQRQLDVVDFRSGHLNKTRNGGNGGHKASSWCIVTLIVTGVVTYCYFT